MAKKPIEVEALKHDAATHKNIPTAEFESVMREADKKPIQLAYERRNRDLDPQLVWRGKDEQDWSDLSSPPRLSTSRRRCIPRSSSTTLSAPATSSSRIWRSRRRRPAGARTRPVPPALGSAQDGWGAGSRGSADARGPSTTVCARDNGR